MKIYKFRKTKTVVTTIFLLIAQIASAHNAIIFGKVVDAQTKQPIENTYIHLNKTNYTTFTNEVGMYELQDIASGTYTLEINAVGYECVNTIITIKDFEKNEQNFSLKNSAIKLSEVKVHSNNLVMLNNNNKINFARMPINIAQDILRIAPGLFIA